MTTALALRVLWIGVTVGLAGCVPGASCLEQAAGSAASYMSSGGAAWDLPADSTDSSAGYVTGYRQRLEQDARAKRRGC